MRVLVNFRVTYFFFILAKILGAINYFRDDSSRESLEKSRVSRHTLIEENKREILPRTIIGIIVTDIWHYPHCRTANGTVYRSQE